MPVKKLFKGGIGHKIDLAVVFIQKGIEII